MSESGRSSKVGVLVVGTAFMAVVIGGMWLLTSGPEPSIPLADESPSSQPTTQPELDPNAPPVLAADVFPAEGKRLVLPEGPRRAFIQSRLDQLGRHEGHVRPLLEISDLAVDAADAIPAIIRYAQTTRQEAWPVFVALGRIGSATPELKTFLLRCLESENEELALVALMQMGRKGDFAASTLSARFMELERLRAQEGIEQLRGGPVARHEQTSYLGMADPRRVAARPRLSFQYAVTILSVMPDSPLAENALSHLLAEGDPDTSHMEGLPDYWVFKSSHYKPTDNPRFWLGENLSRVLVASFQSERLRPTFLAEMVAGTKADMTFEERLGDKAVRKRQAARLRAHEAKVREEEEERLKNSPYPNLPAPRLPISDPFAERLIDDTEHLRARRQQLLEMKARAMRHYAVLSLFASDVPRKTLSESELKALELANATPAIAGRSPQQEGMARLMDPWMLEISESAPEPSIAVSVLALAPAPQDDSYLKFLVEMLRTSQSVRARALSAFAMSRLGELAIDAVPILQEASRSDLSPEVRQTAAWAIQQLGGKDILERAATLQQRIDTEAASFKGQWDELWGPHANLESRPANFSLRTGMAALLLRTPLEFQGLGFAANPTAVESLELRPRDLRFKETLVIRELRPKIEGSIERMNIITGEVSKAQVSGVFLEDGGLNFSTSLKEHSGELSWNLKLDARGVLLGSCRLSFTDTGVSLPGHNVAYRCVKPASIEPRPWQVMLAKEKRRVGNWFTMGETIWTGNIVQTDGKSAELLLYADAPMRGQGEFYGTLKMTRSLPVKEEYFRVAGVYGDDDSVRMKLTRLGGDSDKPVASFVGGHLGDGRIGGEFHQLLEGECSIAWTHDPKGELRQTIKQHLENIAAERKRAEQVAKRPAIPGWLTSHARYAGTFDAPRQEGGFLDFTVTNITLDGDITLDLYVRMPDSLKPEQLTASGKLLKGENTVRLKRPNGRTFELTLGRDGPESIDISGFRCKPVSRKPQEKTSLPTRQAFSGEFNRVAVSRRGNEREQRVPFGMVLDGFLEDKESFHGFLWVGTSKQSLTGTFKDGVLKMETDKLILSGQLGDNGVASGTYQYKSESVDYTPVRWSFSTKQ